MGQRTVTITIVVDDDAPEVLPIESPSISEHLQEFMDEEDYAFEPNKNPAR